MAQALVQSSKALPWYLWRSWGAGRKRLSATGSSEYSGEVCSSLREGRNCRRIGSSSVPFAIFSASLLGKFKEKRGLGKISEMSDSGISRYAKSAFQWVKFWRWIIRQGAMVDIRPLYLDKVQFMKEEEILLF